MRAANIVRAGENLMKLISDLKTFLVIHDFPAINESIEKRTSELVKNVSHEMSRILLFHKMRMFFIGRVNFIAPGRKC